MADRSQSRRRLFALLLVIVVLVSVPMIVAALTTADFVIWNGYNAESEIINSTHLEWFGNEGSNNGPAVWTNQSVGTGSFTVEFDVKITYDPPGLGAHIGPTVGGMVNTSRPLNGSEAAGVRFISFASSSDHQIRVTNGNDVAPLTNAHDEQIDLQRGTEYYVTVERTASQITASVYNDSARTDRWAGHSIERAGWDVQALGVTNDISGSYQPCCESGDSWLGNISNLRYSGTATPTEDTISGTVEDEGGTPVPDATVNILQVNQTELEQQGHTTLQSFQERANELRDRVDDVRPDDFCDADLLNARVLDDCRNEGKQAVSQVTPSDLDLKYVAVHRPGQWTGDYPVSSILSRASPGIKADNQINFRGGYSLPNPPTMQFEEGPTQVAVSVWDPGQESLIEDAVDDDLHGATTNDDVVITEVGPGDSSIQSFTVETEPVVTTGFLGSEHEVGFATLNTGIYRVQPEGGGASYYITVGNPIAEMGDNLRDKADQLSNRSQWIRERLDDNTFEISKVTTNSSGDFSFTAPSNVVNTVLQAYKGPVDRLSVDPQNLTMQNLRDFFNNSDYNGSFYMPSAPTRAEPGDTNLTMQVQEVGAPTSADLDRVEEAWEWMQDFLQNHSYAEALDAIDERLQDVTDGELREAYDQMYNMILENQGLEQRAEDLVEENDELNETLSEMQENLNETVPEDLREAIGELEQTLAEQASSVPSEEEATEIAEDLLTSRRTFDTDLTGDSVMADIRFANGSSARITPESEFMSIEDGGLLGGDVAVIDDFPVGDSAALAVRWHVVTEEGVSKATDRATNPSFGGTVPNLDAIDVTSLAPGPSETVRVNLHPSDDANYGQLESLTVHDPGGSELASTIVDAETAEFTTSGAGVHDVDLQFSDADGQNFTTGFNLIAESAQRPMDPGIRVRESIVGTYALTGDGLDGGSVDLSEGGSTVDVSGRIAQDAEAPGTVHVYGHGYSLSPDATTRISVLRGEAGRTVSQHVRVVYHSPSIGVDGLAWRRVDGEDYALTTGPTQHGQLDRSTQNATIQTVTADNGRVGIRTLKGPGRVDRLRHWVELRLQGLPDFGALVPSIGTMFIFGWTRRRRLTPEETR